MNEPTPHGSHDRKYRDLDVDGGQAKTPHLDCLAAEGSRNKTRVRTLTRQLSHKP